MVKILLILGIPSEEHAFANYYLGLDLKVSRGNIPTNLDGTIKFL